jgi:hypothetical protein
MAASRRQLQTSAALGRLRREQREHSLLGPALGGHVAEFLSLTEVGQRRRDRGALLAAGDDALVDVGGAGHSGSVA